MKKAWILLDSLGKPVDPKALPVRPKGAAPLEDNNPYTPYWNTEDHLHGEPEQVEGIHMRGTASEARNVLAAARVGFPALPFSNGEPKKIVKVKAEGLTFAQAKELFDLLGLRIGKLEASVEEMRASARKNQIELSDDLTRVLTRIDDVQVEEVKEVTERFLRTLNHSKWFEDR